MKRQKYLQIFFAMLGFLQTMHAGIYVGVIIIIII